MIFVKNNVSLCRSYNRIMSSLPAPSMPAPSLSDSKFTQSGIKTIQVPSWISTASGLGSSLNSHLDWLWHGFSTRPGGVSRAYLPEAKSQAAGELNLGFTAHDTREHVVENRFRFVEAVTGSRATPLRTIRQIHSCITVDASESILELPPEADGILTRQSGVLIGIMTADCIPVLVADPVRRAVAAFHAGWRGTVERIVELGIQRMQREIGSDPGDLVAAIGPGIGPCCYAVGEEVFTRFSANFDYSAQLFCTVEDQLRIDLWEANRRQLLAAGLPAAAVSIVGGCTSCHPELYFSHRASAGHAGRMMAAIGLRG
jgi:YfiH family protein